MKRRLISLAAFLAASTANAANALAASMSELQGAWVMEGVDCAKVFEKQGQETRFKNRSASTAAGIIVSGDKVIGPQMICTTEKILNGKDHYSAYLNCADTIIFSGVSVSFRIIDRDHFDRFDPVFPDSSTRYYRCAQ